MKKKSPEKNIDCSKETDLGNKTLTNNDPFKNINFNSTLPTSSD